MFGNDLIGALCGRPPTPGGQWPMVEGRLMVGSAISCR